MPFIVKITDTDGNAGWLTQLGPDEIRNVGPRSNAATFSDRREAAQAIASLMRPHLLTVVSYQIEDAVY